MMTRMLFSMLRPLVICACFFSVMAGFSASAGEAIGIVTGTETGTYYRFGQDIAKVAAKEKIAVEIKPSAGSIANIERIASAENAGLGIVQSDVLGFLTRSEQPQSRKIAQNLRLVFPFYQEEVHLVAQREIQSLQDLNGKTLVVGNAGSGSWLTAMNILNLTGVKPGRLLRLSPDEGLVAVLRGEADATLLVAGKPMKLISNLSRLATNQDYQPLLANLHLVPVVDASLNEEYEKAEIPAGSYIFEQEATPTVAVRALLVAYDFAGDQNHYAIQRCAQIRDLSKAMARHMSVLRMEGHEKWKEVRLDANVTTWKRDECSFTKEETLPLENELLNLIR